MNNRRYKWILYFITLVILTTITIQFYWNYKNYLSNKQQLISDVQTSLDNAVENYYAELAEKTTVGIFLEGDQQQRVFDPNGEIDEIFEQIDSLHSRFNNLDSLDVNPAEGITILKGKNLDSLSELQSEMYSNTHTHRFDSLSQQQINLQINDYEMLTSKIVVSISNDSLDLVKIDSLLHEEFKQKQITIDSKLNFYESSVQKQVQKIADSMEQKIEHHYTLTARSRSSFLPRQSILELEYNNSTITILQRSLNGILISTLLVLTVIGCLFYLLRIINQQKQLGELKNDLISNITHEFKTPIATIGVAIESINDFETMNDKDRTKKYLNMSQMQLNKLNNMVEKLLETASLDSQDLKLNKDKVDIVELLHQIIAKQDLLKGSKTINFNSSITEYTIHVDSFHIENAVTNIIDNAIKYGGNIIDINLSTLRNKFQIVITDNGNTLNQNHKTKIFDKFYRVPKGNTHDVKGFGIGLFYTKTIIEKHGGTIELSLKNNRTSFIIDLPNV